MDDQPDNELADPPICEEQSPAGSSKDIRDSVLYGSSKSLCVSLQVGWHRRTSSSRGDPGSPRAIPLASKVVGAQDRIRESFNPAKYFTEVIRETIHKSLLVDPS